MCAPLTQAWQADGYSLIHPDMWILLLLLIINCAQYCACIAHVHNMLIIMCLYVQASDSAHQMEKKFSLDVSECNDYDRHIGCYCQNSLLLPNNQLRLHCACT